MDKEKLFDILLKVSELKMNIETAEKRILLLSDIRCNEGLQKSKIKGETEVAVCDVCRKEFTRKKASNIFCDECWKII